MEAKLSRAYGSPKVSRSLSEYSSAVVRPFQELVLKGNHHRTFPISPPVAENLMLWFESRGPLKPTDPILLDAKGRRLTRGGLSDYMTSIGKSAEIPFAVRPHMFRHTKNVIRRLGGLDSLPRSALLAHTNPSSITAYEKLQPDELVDARRRETEALAAYLADANEGDYADGLSGKKELPPSPVSKPVKKLKP